MRNPAPTLAALAALLVAANAMAEPGSLECRNRAGQTIACPAPPPPHPASGKTVCTYDNGKLLICETPAPASEKSNPKSKKGDIVRF